MPGSVYTVPSMLYQYFKLCEPDASLQYSGLSVGPAQLYGSHGVGAESSPAASAACSIATHALAAAGAMLTSSPPPSLGPLDTWLDESCSPLSRLSSAPRYTCSPVVRAPGVLAVTVGI